MCVRSENKPINLPFPRVVPSVAFCSLVRRLRRGRGHYPAESLQVFGLSRQPGQRHFCLALWSSGARRMRGSRASFTSFLVWPTSDGNISIQNHQAMPTSRAGGDKLFNGFKRAESLKNTGGDDKLEDTTIDGVRHFSRSKMRQMR